MSVLSALLPRKRRAFTPFYPEKWKLEKVSQNFYLIDIQKINNGLKHYLPSLFHNYFGSFLKE